MHSKKFQTNNPLKNLLFHLSLKLPNNKFKNSRFRHAIEKKLKHVIYMGYNFFEQFINSLLKSKEKKQENFSLMFNASTEKLEK